MAALPENYVSLQHLRERFLKRQQESQGRDLLHEQRCEGDDRRRSPEGRKPEGLSGKSREREEHRTRDIADRRRSYYRGQIKDGGGDEGKGRRGMDVPVEEGFTREWRCAGRKESKVGSCATEPEDGRKLSREKEIAESSCFASAVVEDSYRGDSRLKSSDQRWSSFKKSDSGPVRAKEGDARGNRPRPFGKNDEGGRDDVGSRRELTAPAVEIGALERPRNLSREKEIVESSCFASAVVEDSYRGDCRLKSSDQRQTSFKKLDSGPVRAKEGDARGNRPRPFGKNDEGGRDDGGSRRELAAPAAEIGALERPRNLLHEKEIVESSCFASAVVEDGYRGDCRLKSSDQRQRSFKKLDSGLVRAKESDARGNCPRPFRKNDGGGRDDGGSRRELAAPAAEIGALERPRNFSREKEIVESSCFASAVVEDNYRADCRLKSSDQRQKSFKKSDSDPVRAKEGEALGNWPCPFGKNDGDGRDDGGSQRELAAPAAESGALEQPSPRRSDSEVRLGAQKSTIAPEDGEGIMESVCFVSAIVGESSGKEAKGEVFLEKSGKSKKKSSKSNRKSHGKNQKDAGVVGVEEGQGGGSWLGREFHINENGDSGDGRSRRDMVAPVAKIVALGRPRRPDSKIISGNKMPTDGLESPPVKELVESVCFTGAIFEESSAKKIKSEEYERKSGGGCSWRRCDKVRKKPDVVRGKEEEDWGDNMADDGHDAPACAVKQECRRKEMTSEEDLKRCSDYQRKGREKKKPVVALKREEEEQLDKLADGHDTPLKAVTSPGGKESMASEVKDLGVNGSGNGRRIVSGPRKNSFSYRARVVVREDIEIQEDFARDKKAAVSREVEPANKSSGTEGKLGIRQKNDLSCKEMVFCSDEGEVTRKLRDFSIGSSGRRGGRKKKSTPRADNNRSWSRGNSDRGNGVSASRMERDMVWVKKEDVLGGNNADDVTRAH